MKNKESFRIEDSEQHGKYISFFQFGYTYKYGNITESITEMITRN